MNIRRSIVWFRQDLRLHDNEALTDAINICDEIIPVFVFDIRLFTGKSRYGFPKISPHRAKLLIESVTDLRNNLKSRGSDLLVRVGIPEDIIFELASTMKTSWVYCNRERTKEELEVQNTLEKKLWTIGQEILFYRGKMLLYTSDLPFPVTHTPDSFSQFRKEIESFVPMREPIATVQKVNTPPGQKLDYGKIPTLQDLGFDEYQQDSRSLFPFKGGESEGLKRLQDFIWGSKSILNFKENRDQMGGVNYSSKFSPYLALGCISPKLIYNEVKRFESQYGVSESTSLFISELLMRDFYRLMAKKYVNKIFLKGGPLERIRTDLEDNFDLFNKWASAETGIPYVDANMLELKHTGYISDKGRLHVARFLINDLKVNWQLGAEWFEANLIDYDPSSNWGNWNHIARLGADQKPEKPFNIYTQAKRFDPSGAYIRNWLPQLNEVPDSYIHTPEAYAEMMGFSSLIAMGIPYPDLIIPNQLHS